MTKFQRLLLTVATLFTLLNFVGLAYLIRFLQDLQSTANKQTELLEKNVNIQSTQNPNDSVLKEIIAIKALLTSKSLNNQQTLGVSTEEATPPANPTTAGLITIKDSKWSSLDAYEKKTVGSKIVGKIQYGKNYQLLRKEGEWYYLRLSESSFGWVIDQFVKEI